MSVLKMVTAIAVASFGALSAFGAGNPTSYNGDHIHTTKPSYKVGGDEVIFGIKSANSCGLNDLKTAALSLKNRSRTDRWDDLWYAFRVSPGECWVFGWYDLTSHKYGWAAVQNKPNTWAVRSNAAGWTDLGNGQQKKYHYTINSQSVDLDIFNPQNEGGLTGNDILLSFGF